MPGSKVTVEALQGSVGLEPSMRVRAWPRGDLGQRPERETSTSTMMFSVYRPGLTVS